MLPVGLQRLCEITELGFQGFVLFWALGFGGGGPWGKSPGVAGLRSWLD